MTRRSRSGVLDMNFTSAAFARILAHLSTYTHTPFLCCRCNAIYGTIRLCNLVQVHHSETCCRPLSTRKTETTLDSVSRLNRSSGMTRPATICIMASLALWPSRKGTCLKDSVFAQRPLMAKTCANRNSDTPSTEQTECMLLSLEGILPALTYSHTHILTESAVHHP